MEYKVENDATKPLTIFEILLPGHKEWNLFRATTTQIKIDNLLIIVKDNIKNRFSHQLSV